MIQIPTRLRSVVWFIFFYYYGTGFCYRSMVVFCDTLFEWANLVIGSLRSKIEWNCGENAIKINHFYLVDGHHDG
jgi:hypothetical protein